MAAGNSGPKKSKDGTSKKECVNVRTGKLFFPSARVSEHQGGQKPFSHVFFSASVDRRE